MQLKTYTEDMLPAVQAHYDECFNALGWGYEPNGRHADTLNVPKVYQKDGGEFWCLFDGAELVGAVGLRPLDERGSAELKRLYIKPSRQGEGFGKILFNTAIEFAKTAGFAKVYADTRRECAASRHMMEACGFKEIHRYNDNAYAELFFELHLKGGIQIIPAAQEHLNAVYALVCELEEHTLPREEFELVYSKNLLKPDIFYLLAIAEGVPVGFGTLHVQSLLHHYGGVAEIHELVVAKEHQGRGIGSRLWQSLREIAVQKNCNLLEVCCNRSRVQSHPFYEAQAMQCSHFKFTYYL
ncbi:MAG: GNAT family N-acetyltransferase [Oscillospiraceae bacterium]|jgi:PhnO protein|nr:GNAT family N-acetyltransferase [Oscillospiraceae bacterium]